MSTAARGGLGAHPALTTIGFDDLPGWADDDHRAALAAFRRGAGVLADHPPKQRALGVDPEALRIALKAGVDAGNARAFFERSFTPVLVEEPAHYTGYYEPEVAGSRMRAPGYTVPLHGVPDDLVEVTPGTVPGLDPEFRFARMTSTCLDAYHDRGAIQTGALDGRGLEIAWLADPVDAFFIHIQGAARLRLPDGGTMRVTYAAKSGHPYTPIGRVLIDRGELPPGGATMQTIRAWLQDNPHERDAVLAANRSYIFFREAPVTAPELGPIAAAKLPLTAGRSLAVDRTLWSFHLPVWIETTLPDGAPLNRLMVAQDTGSAIVGAARGDVFFGSGDAAGEIAGRMNARGRFVVLVPKGVSA